MDEACDRQNCQPDGHVPLVNYRKIALFGGPGTGKSTVAHWMMWQLKSLGIQAEMSREWIKRWAYAKRPMDRLTDQLIVMGAQLQEEQEALATGCIVITDSPILLQAAYATIGSDIQRAIETEVGLQERHKTLNLFLLRADRMFTPVGRWESEMDARIKDSEIRDVLDNSGLAYTPVLHNDYDAIWRAMTT